MILQIAVGVAVVAVGIAFYKHKTLAGVEASAKKEIAYLENFSTKIGATLKADFNSAVSRLKSIF